MTPDDLRTNAIADAVKALEDLGESVENLRTQIDLYGSAVFMAAQIRGAWQLDGCPIHAVGSHGNLQAHPVIRALERAEAHADKLAASLNLTPESRARRRVGAPMGSSTATDRRGPTRLRKAA
jgi:phage terminase small subunit